MALIGRVAYAVLFCVILPVLLAGWARATADIVPLPVYGNLALAILAGAVGLLLFGAGVLALWRRGGGLPMNAFPPPRLVVTGIYGIFPHPIYTGFCLVCLAAAMAVHSASGLWLVTPTATLGCVALVYGYEKPDLARRFGPEALKAIHCLPPPTPDRPVFADWLRFLLFVLIPWLSFYEIIAVLGVQHGSINTVLPFEARLPVWPWTEGIYASVYLAAMIAPLLTPTKRDLRTLTVRLWLAMAVVFPLYLFLPTQAPFRPFAGGGAVAGLVRFERLLDMPAEAFPSFHVTWAILLACATRRPAAALWAGAVALSCVMNGTHSMADVAGGGALTLLLLRSGRVWERLRAASEWLANSWGEYRLGRFRLINHALYGGLATFVCLAIVSALTGPRHLAMVALTAAAGLVGAGIWAQGVEGSSRLLRPFGFYGGLISVIAVACLTPHPWLLLGAYSVGGPWLQALGRLRCLVQGCCHGRPADVQVGIRYRHPRSRVVRIGRLKDVPLHPTPLYSILCNLVTALVVGRLWSQGAPLSMIGGVFLILNGLGRFVEETYRGEPQTPVIAGLRMYQWIAIGTVLGGAAVTCLSSAPAPPPEFTWEGIEVAAFFGLIAALAVGADFPESNRRFARLT